MKAPLSIGKLAKSANVNVETIRYYQRIGMITEPTKPYSGHRVYDSSLVNTVKFIKRSQQLGFKLSEIKELLDLGNGHCHDVMDMAKEKSAKILKQIEDLTSMKIELDKLIDECELTENTAKCAIIDSLTKNN